MDRSTRPALAACAALATALTLAATSAQAAMTMNRLATNRLATNRLATNRLATNRLATNALSSGALEANLETADILQTAEGRDVYSYLVSCALAAGTVIEATVPGAPDTGPPEANYICAGGRCSFYGSLGLAVDWVDHRLASKDERWISACIFARVNANDTAEAVSPAVARPVPRWALT